LAQPETIIGVFRVLRPGGRLVIVPQARLTGDSALTRFIEWLFAITGQRPTKGAYGRNAYWQVVEDRFRGLGFTLRIEQVDLKASQVTVVVAEKPAV
jgi:hypothetical protein